MFREPPPKEVEGIVVSIDEPWVNVNTCKQQLRRGYDTPHDVEVGDRVIVKYGVTGYGYGWRITEVL